MLYCGGCVINHFSTINSISGAKYLDYYCYMNGIVRHLLLQGYYTCTVITGILQPITLEITTDPVFIKDSDVNIRGNIVIELCREIDKRWIGEALGAQKFHQVWKIYVKSPPTRAALIVSGLNVNGKNVSVYDENPNNDNNKLSERVVIKDLPATIPPDRILSYLRGLPQTHYSLTEIVIDWVDNLLHGSVQLLYGLQTTTINNQYGSADKN